MGKETRGKKKKRICASARKIRFTRGATNTSKSSHKEEGIEETF